MIVNKEIFLKQGTEYVLYVLYPLPMTILELPLFNCSSKTKTSIYIQVVKKICKQVYLLTPEEINIVLSLLELLPPPVLNELPPIFPILKPVPDYLLNISEEFINDWFCSEIKYIKEDEIWMYCTKDDMLGEIYEIRVILPKLESFLPQGLEVIKIVDLLHREPDVYIIKIQETLTELQVYGNFLGIRKYTKDIIDNIPNEIQYSYLKGNLVQLHTPLTIILVDNPDPSLLEIPTYYNGKEIKAYYPEK